MTHSGMSKPRATLISCVLGLVFPIPPATFHPAAFPLATRSPLVFPGDRRCCRRDSCRCFRGGVLGGFRRFACRGASSTSSSLTPQPPPPVLPRRPSPAGAGMSSALRTTSARWGWNVVPAPHPGAVQKRGGGEGRRPKPAAPQKQCVCVECWRPSR